MHRYRYLFTGLARNTLDTTHLDTVAPLIHTTTKDYPQPLDEPTLLES